MEEVRRSNLFDEYPSGDEFFESMVEEWHRQEYDNDPKKFFLIFNGNNRVALKKSHPDVEEWVSVFFVERERSFENEEGVRVVGWKEFELKLKSERN